MKAVVQRCKSASVSVDGQIVGQVEAGLAVFLGVEQGDDESKAAKMAAKIAALRIFNDPEGRFNLSLKDIGGGALVISNFTLCGDARKGNRPSFTGAAAPEPANQLYEAFAKLLEAQGVPVGRGIFGADMRVLVENDGPVTIILEM